MAVLGSLSAVDILARGLGIFGSGFFFGCTASTSTVIIPMIQNQKGLTVKQRLELWDQQFTLSVTRWTPLGILGALCYLYAAYSWSGEITTASDYKSSTTLTWAGGAMLGMIPLTVTLIFPVVGKLKKLKSLPSEQLKDRSSEVRGTIAQWDRRHWGRITCSGFCFLLGIYDVVQLLRP